MASSVVNLIASATIFISISVGTFEIGFEAGWMTGLKAFLAAKAGKNLGVSHKNEACLGGCDSAEAGKNKEVLTFRTAVENLTVDHSIDDAGDTKTTMGIKAPVYNKGILKGNVGFKTVVQENKKKDSTAAYLLNNLAAKIDSEKAKGFLTRPYLPKDKINKPVYLPITGYVPVPETLQKTNPKISDLRFQDLHLKRLTYTK